MRVAKRIVITSTTREVLTVRASGFVEAFCPLCSDVGRFLTLDQAVGQTGLSIIELVRRIGAGSIHTLETGGGHLLVCRESLGTEQGKWK